MDERSRRWLALPQRLLHVVATIMMRSLPFRTGRLRAPDSGAWYHNPRREMCGEER